MEENKHQLKAGNARSCFVASYLSARAENAGIDDAPGRGLTDDGEWMRDTFIAYTGANILGAGSETTASSIQSFVLFMLAHPNVLQRAREEIDQVVGDLRMPSFEDEEDLPFLVACIKETLRLRPVTIMGRILNRDFQYCAIIEFKFRDTTRRRPGRRLQRLPYPSGLHCLGKCVVYSYGSCQISESHRFRSHTVLQARRTCDLGQRSRFYKS